MASLEDPDGIRDPFQGLDISVKVLSSSLEAAPVLQGGFTGFMCRIQCTTEAYLELNERVPRMLDGEFIITWMLEQGFKALNPVSQTFGAAFARAFAKGRVGNNVIPRTRRFTIQMDTATSPLKDVTKLEHETFYSDVDIAKLKAFKLTLGMCRVDNGSFGVTAGKRVASSSWQGSCEGIDVVEGS